MDPRVRMHVASTTPAKPGQVMKESSVMPTELMPNPDPRDVPMSANSEFVVKQISDGVDLTDLNLPATPRAEVAQWEEELPLNIREHESLSPYVFRWLFPKGRERTSMDGWQYVAGDLARAVRRCGIIPALIGGDDSDEMIRSGDLILGWRSRSVNEAHKQYNRNKANAARRAADEQVEASNKMRSGSSGRFIEATGEVSSYTGPLQE